MKSSIVGREVELAAVERLLAGSTAAPALLELAGVAGVGKTTIWEAGLERARLEGRRVLSARGAGTEVRLGYAALGDLLVELDDGVLTRLPVPQRRALETALLRRADDDAVPPDPRAVATGLLSALEALAEAGPLVVAVDDLQWLDPSSADALAFVVRRLGGPVAILVAARREAGVAERRLELRDAGRIERLTVSPLSAAEIERLLRHRGGPAPARTRLRQIVEIAAGNPFVALELARTLDAEDLDVPAELPQNLRELVDARLAALAPDVGEAVLHAAVLTRPSVALVAEALPAGDAGALLEQAEAAGILTLRGADVVFSHPLIATGAYAAAPGPARRAVHRRVAAITAGEERARHLALASLGAEPDVVAALDEAAAGARARGASSDAAELLELALRLGAGDAPRRALAAEHHLDAGNLGRARELLEGLVDELPPGSERAAALGGLGTVHRLDEDLLTSKELLERALAETGDDGFRLRLSLELAFANTQAGALAEAIVHADAAVALAERLGVPGPLAQALAVRTMVQFLAGRGVDEATLARSLELEDHFARTAGVLRPSFIAGLIKMWTGRLEEAHLLIESAREEYRERGEESDLVYMTIHQGSLACARGDVEFGRQVVADSLERAWQLGSPSSLAVALENQVVVAGWCGDLETARRAGEESLRLAEQVGSPVGEMFTRAALGRVELSLGDHAAAAEQLGRSAMTAIALGSGDPDTLPGYPDAIEALAACGRVEEAEELRAWQRRQADAIGRPTVLALAARGDGVVRAARGELEEAEASLLAAVAEHERLPVPFELGRTLLVLGQVQRRLRRRAGAREALTRARDAFAGLGAVLWAARAEAELERLDPAGSGSPELTPAEERIALLAGTGMTNRDVAAELFVSPKTVEATLSRVYRKLGIRSRAELGRWIALRESQSVTSSSATQRATPSG
jgi:DNA-binding CsgD family transcriptional regulator